MTQKILRTVREIDHFGVKFLALLLFATAVLEAETNSFNNIGDFTNQFTQRAGSGENSFEEADSIGVSGSRGVRRTATGTETIAYTKNGSIDGLLDNATLSLRFNYSTNSTGSGGDPLFIGISSNSEFDGSETGNSSDDFIGVVLSQRLTGSNESKLTIFNGVNGSRSESADTGFENLTPGWFEIELSLNRVGGSFDLFVTLHQMSSDGSSRVVEDVVTAAISSLSNPDILSATNLFLYVGGSDTLNRGVEAIDELNYTGFGTPVSITAPGNLVAVAISNGRINLTWSDNSTNETSFLIQRRQGGGAWAEIASVPSNSESFADLGLTNDTTYDYRIVATNGETSSSPSNEASATTSGEPPPNVPTNMVATAISNSQVDLSWTDTSANENWFRIERKVGNSTFNQLIDLAQNVTSYSDIGLTANTSYTYRISSANAAGLSQPSNESGVTTPNLSITAPSSLVATTISHLRINLTWSDNSNNETSFSIQRHQGSGTWTEIATVPSNTVGYFDLGLASDTTYFYRIVASNSETSSSPSNEASSTTTGEPPPNIPENLVASANSMTQVDLTWIDASDNESWFRIERKVGDGDFSLLIDLAPNVTSHSDSGLTPITSYTYRIRAASAVGLSQPSNEAEATTPDVPVPAAPSNLQSTGLGLSLISLSWIDNADDESGYRIERKAGNGDFIQIAELAAGSISFDDTDVTELETYIYLVHAYNSNGVSAFSNLTQVDFPFFSPTNLTAQAISDAQVDLNWIDNSEVETSYRIERKIGNGPYITIVNVGNSVSSFSDLTVNPLTNYTYRILGISFGNFPDFSNEATTTTPDLVPPMAPSSLAIVAQALDYVILQWVDTSGDETGFRVERKTGAGGWETLTNLEPDVTVFTDNQVDELGIYTYRVVSFNDAGVSTPTNLVATQIEFNHPTNLVALAISSAQIDLTWHDNSSAESVYRVERKSAQGGFAILSTLSANSSTFSDSNVEPLSTYTYRVVAVAGGTESNSTNEASANTPSIPVPGSADNLVANLIDASYIVLNWTDNSIDESGFRIDKRVGAGGWSELFQVPANTTVFQDAAVGELETFFYRVIAFNDGGDSSASNVASAEFPFNPATNLNVQASAQSQIDVTWDDNSLVETGYRVERKSGEGSFEALFTTEAGVSAFTDLNAEVDVLYTYRVIGVYLGGESSPTNEASATSTADEIIPNAPNGLAANAIDYDQIHLTWTDNADNESGFRVERKLGAEGTFEFIGNVSTDSTSFTDRNLQPDTTYYYRIASFVNGAQSSEVTTEAFATTLTIPVPEAPSSLEVASQTSGVVSLSWIENSEVETGFKVQRKVGVGEFEDLAIVNKNTTYFNDTTVVEAQSYRYRVVAYNIGGDSSPSNEVLARIFFAPPILLVVNSVASTEVELSWVDQSLIETGYRIQRKKDFGAWTNVGNIGANAILYTDDSTVPNTTYSYRVVAMLNGLESGSTNVVNVTTPNSSPPDVPTDLIIESLSETSISISWTDNSNNEDGFRVMRKEIANGIWIEIASVAADVNLFVDTSALPGVSYSYQVFAFNGGGEDIPAEYEFRIPIAGRLINISTRGLVEAGDNVMIGSFIIQGDGPKTVFIRGIGPSLAPSMDVPVLNDPEVTLVSGINLNNPIAYNDDWRDTDEAGILATGLPPGFESESALVIKLQPGAYSAILSGVNFTTGFGLIEVYEMDYSKNIRIVNISTRSFVQTDDKRMIGGFVVLGDSPARVFIRASGPSLSASIENRLIDPTLELYAGQELLASNDNWQEGENIGLIIDSGIPPTSLDEPAIVATLEPGTYTAVVGGANNSSGYSLLEIYDYPE